jgi:hypothetical protein
LLRAHRQHGEGGTTGERQQEQARGRASHGILGAKERQGTTSQVARWLGAPCKCIASHRIAEERRGEERGERERREGNWPALESGEGAFLRANLDAAG